MGDGRYKFAALIEIMKLSSVLVDVIMDGNLVKPNYRATIIRKINPIFKLINKKILDTVDSGEVAGINRRHAIQNNFASRHFISFIIQG